MDNIVRRKWKDRLVVRIAFCFCLALAIILTLIFWNSGRGETGTLLAGKPVSYWLRSLPFEADRGFVGFDHPLEQAGPEIIPDLIAAIETKRDRYSFYSKFIRFFPPPVAKLLPPPDAPIHRVKTFAAFRLGQFGPAASNAAPALADYYRSKTNASGVDRVIQALGNIGPASEPALPVLLEAFGNPQVPKSWAANTLLQIGKVPAEAIPYLENEVSSGQDYSKGIAVVALSVAKRDRESLELVHSFLQSSNRSHRAYTAFSLHYQPQISAETKQILFAMLSDKEQGVPQAAAVALAHAGERSEELVSTLIEGLKRGEFRIPCALALGRLGSMAKEAIPELRNYDTNSPALCRAFLKATKQISGE